MKSYTDIEQSKILNNILSFDTADMYYQYVLPWSCKLHFVPSIGNPSEALKWYNMGYEKTGQPPMELNDFCVPCWSLAALIEAMPEILIETVKARDGYDGYYYFVTYEEEEIGVPYEKELIDACVEMILRLHEQKLI